MISEKFEESLFTVRFIGPTLAERGVGIYDLGITLVSFQRLIHKAYLVGEGRLSRGKFPRKDEREWLSLQIGERKKQSDAYALVPILLDPTARETLKYLADSVFNGLVGYFTGDVVNRIKNEKDEDKKLFIGSIYAETVNIVSRIDASGHVDKIEIGSPGTGKSSGLSFDKKHKEYMAELKEEYFLGSEQSISGNVYKMYPNSKIIEIKRKGQRKCTVFLTDELFDKIRYGRTDNKIVTFHGRPRYLFGVETRAITDFEAYEIEISND